MWEMPLAIHGRVVFCGNPFHLETKGKTEVMLEAILAQHPYMEKKRLLGLVIPVTCPKGNCAICCTLLCATKVGWFFPEAAFNQTQHHAVQPT